MESLLIRCADYLKIIFILEMNKNSLNRENLLKLVFKKKLIEILNINKL